MCASWARLPVARHPDELLPHSGRLFGFERPDIGGLAARPLRHSLTAGSTHRGTSSCLAAVAAGVHRTHRTIAEGERFGCGARPEV